MAKGFFLTLEGTEGTGKSTQARLLGEELVRRGWPVVLTREPGGTRLGERLRSILLDADYGEISSSSELFLYMADRAQHVAELIAPALEGGSIVICDRYADATMAYQGSGRGIPRPVIAELNERATLGCRPDLTILLDMDDVAAGLRRAVRRNEEEGLSGVEDRFEGEEMEFHQRVRDGYRGLAAEEPDRIRTVPASLSVEETGDSILREVLEALERRGLAPERRD
jgi:dTMP kinase